MAARAVDTHLRLFVHRQVVALEDSDEQLLGALSEGGMRGGLLK